MGYTTEFYGEIIANPPLNETETSFLKRFSQTRRVQRNHSNQGKYFLSDGTDLFGQNTPNIKEPNTPPDGQPGLWCNWISNSNGNLSWNGGEKFYEAEKWMLYINEHFLKENCFMKINEPYTYEKFQFQEHKLNGVIYAKGEDPSDLWKLVVKDSEIFVSVGQVKPEVIFDNLKTTVPKNLNREQLEELLFNAWDNLSNITDNMAEWGPLNKIQYTPPMSDLCPEPLALETPPAPKRLFFR